MGDTIRFHTAYVSPVVQVREAVCRPLDHACGGEECTHEHSIVFVRRGAFVKHVGRRQVVADANQVVFFQRGEAYRVSHPVAGGDDCVTFSLPDPVLLELLRAYDPAAEDRPERPFPRGSVPSPPHVDLGQRALFRAASRAGAPDLELDELVLTLLARAVGELFSAGGPKRERRRPDTARAHRELAGAVQAELSRQWARELPLADLARAVHSSPFHLCRVFRAEIGTSIHHYRNRLRLRAALERLAAGEPDTTALALDLGFSSRGHFSDSFRREFGLAPAAYRRIATGRLLRELSKILGA